ncbi:MAG: DUF433 domain-containing protein [Acidobacteriota bacterium]
MTDLERAQIALSSLSRADKARLLEWILHDLGGVSPGIEITPDVVGGAARIVRTRIPVWTLVHARQLGASDVEILRMFPRLRAEDLVQAWAYYRSHRDEIDQQIEANEAA